MSNNNLKVVKLKSGDNVIAELVESNKKNLKLFRPMEIKYMNFVDGLGRRHEALVLTDWLKSTTSNEFVVDKDFILGIFTPNPDVLTVYDKQKNFDDNQPWLNQPSSMSGNEMSNILDALDRQLANLGPKDIKRMIDNKLPEEDNMDDEEQSPEDLIRNIIKQNQKEKLIDEEADPDYGSSYCDWSPDIEDYLS